MRPYVYAVFPRVAPYFPHVAVLGIVLSGVGQFYKPDTGFTSLIMFGEQFETSASAYLQRTPHAVDRGSGYDGQFYAQIALDPLLRSRSTLNALDSAPYRGRRILLPWVSHLAGFGQPWFVLQAYALVNVACWIGLALLLLRWLPAGQLRAVFAWTACLLSDGLLSSMRQSLPDGPSMLLLALGVAAAEQQRRNAAAGLLGLAGLARETNLLGAVILIPDRLTMGEVARFAGRLVMVAAPLLLWVGYLWYSGMPPDDRGHRNFAPVFSGFTDKWVTTVAILRADGWDSFARFSLVALIGLTTQLAGTALATRLAQPVVAHGHRVRGVDGRARTRGLGRTTRSGGHPRSRADGHRLQHPGGEVPVVLAAVASRQCGHHPRRRLHAATVAVRLVMVRAFFTVALAAASLSVLATRVPLDFGRIRFRVVTSPIPAKDNSVSASLPDVSALAGTAPPSSSAYGAQPNQPNPL